jgi:hypothetical protein
MSWLFSQALVEEYSEATSLDGEPSVQSSGSHTQLAYLQPDKMTDFSRLSRFGMTFAPLTVDRGEALLMSYLAGFHAKTSQSQERATDLTENGQDSGEKWRGWLAKFDPVTSTLRTAQCSLLEEEPESLQTLPRSGMTRSGMLWARQTLVLRTSETESGFLLPTPDTTNRDNKKVLYSKNAPSQSGRSLATYARTWPTPTVHGNYNRKGLSKTSGDGLATAVTKWPTPTAHNAKETNAPSEHNRNTPTLTAQAGGSLNPTWVEWLMGWPLGWTDLKPLEMDKFQQWQQQHGVY